MFRGNLSLPLAIQKLQEYSNQDDPRRPLQLVTERRIANYARKFPHRRIEARKRKDRVKATPVTFNMCMAIVMEQEVDFAYASQNLMNLNSVDMLKREVNLPPLDIQFWLSYESIVYVVPHLKQCFEQKTTAACCWINYEVIVIQLK